VSIVSGGTVINRVSRIFKWITDNWAAVGLCLSVLGILTAWLFYGVSIFQPFEEIAARQAEYRDKLKQKEFQQAMVERHLKLGKTFLDNSRYKAAKAEFENVLKLDKMNPDAQMGLFKTGLYEAMLGEYIPEVVERQIHFILQEKPKDPHALVLKGNLYAQLEDIDTAEEQYKKAIESDKETASAWFGLGIIYQKQDKADEALRMYKEAVKLSKWNERYLNNLASIYCKKEDYANAVENYELVLTLDYEYLLPYCEVALAYRLMGNLERAGDYQSRLVSYLYDENFSGLDKNKGVWFFETDSKTVVSLYSLAEKRCYALYSLSMTLFLLGNNREAEQHARQGHDIETDQKASILNLVRWDLQRFEQKHPEDRERANEYRQMFL
jgi:tetratricopeptide (TPR) repeat protein